MLKTAYENGCLTALHKYALPNARMENNFLKNFAVTNQGRGNNFLRDAPKGVLKGLSRNKKLILGLLGAGLLGTTGAHVLTKNKG